MNCDKKFTEYEYRDVPVQDNHSKKQDNSKYGYGVRHVQLVIFLLCLTVNFTARGHMGVTIVAMTSNCKENSETLNTTVHISKQRYSSSFENDSVDIQNETLLNRSFQHTTLGTTTTRARTYDWPKSTQEMVLSSFFVGYCIMMFPIGMVCQRWGGKLPLQVALFGNGIASILTPWLTNWGGWKAVCFCRVLQGLAQAGTYPSIQTLLAKWVPASERATLSSYVYTGTSLGNVIALQLGGILGDSRWGWPATFWAVGAICMTCWLLLTLLGAATPLEHKSITEEEKNFILGKASDRTVRKFKTPWVAILKTKPLWGTIVTHMGSTVCFVFFFHEVPSYIHHILGTNIKSSGFLSSLPYIAAIFSSLAYGPISDYFTNNNIISLTNARRISNSFSQFGMALSLICVSYTTNVTVTIVYLVIAMSTHTAIHTGWMVNHIDLAPNFSGTLMAIGNTLSTAFVVLLPLPVSRIITDMTNVYQWRIAFFMIAGLCLVTNAIFVLVMSSDTQSWNHVESHEACLEEQNSKNDLEKKENK